MVHRTPPKSFPALPWCRVASDDDGTIRRVRTRFLVGPDGRAAVRHWGATHVEPVHAAQQGNMLRLWIKWIGWSRRRQLRFSVSSGDVRPLSSRRPLKLDNPAKLCWFHAVAQYASAATVELRPDVEFSSIQATLGKSWQLLRTLVALPACAEAACDRFTGRRR